MNTDYNSDNESISDIDSFSNIDSDISEYFDIENDFNYDLINEFNSDLCNYYEKQLNDFIEYKNNPTTFNLKSYKLKYPHIKKKLGKNTKLNTIKHSTISIAEFIKITNNRHDEERKYSEDK